MSNPNDQKQIKIQPAKDYERMIQLQLRYLPAKLQAELANRAMYDPLFLEQAMGIQEKYDPRLAQEQFDALQRRDPQWVALHQGLGDKIKEALDRGYVDPRQEAAYQRMSELAGRGEPQRDAAYGALGKQVTGDTLRGSTASPSMLRDMTQAILSRSPNLSYGEAQDMAAAVYTGQRGQALQQQRQQATGQFLQTATPTAQREASLAQFYGQAAPEMQAYGLAGTFIQPSNSIVGAENMIGGVTSPSAFRYVNPYAGQQGLQYGLQNQQAQLYNQSQGGGGNPWTNALTGAAQGASMGSIGGGYGMAGGAIAGGVLGAFGYPQYSDIRTKTDIVKVGEHNGLDVIEFRYKRGKTRYRGVVAQQVREKFPDAVSSSKGYLTVDYSKIGMPMERWCKKCERFMPIENFQKNVRARDGRLYLCAECWNSDHALYRTNYRRENAENIRANKTMRLLKCDKPTAIRLNVARSVATECDICGRPPDKQGFVHDHCHKSGRLRGLLCRDCNTALGLFRDDPLVLRRAIEHLEKEGWDVARKEAV